MHVISKSASITKLKEAWINRDHFFVGFKALKSMRSFRRYAPIHVKFKIMQRSKNSWVILWCLGLQCKSFSLPCRSMAKLLMHVGASYLMCNFWTMFVSSEIFKKNSDVLLTLKAYNGRVVLEWLCDEVINFSMDDSCTEVDPRSYHIATALILVLFCVCIELKWTLWPMFEGFAVVKSPPKRHLPNKWYHSNRYNLILVSV